MNPPAIPRFNPLKHRPAWLAMLTMAKPLRDRIARFIDFINSGDETIGKEVVLNQPCSMSLSAANLSRDLVAICKSSA